MKFDIILQARYNSKRLPGKMLLKLGNLTVIEFLIKNLKKIKLVNKICLAIPAVCPRDRKIALTFSSGLPPAH